MKQQVNLYQPIFRRQRKVFSAVTMVQIAVIVLLGLVLLYAFSRWQEAAVAADVAVLVKQREAAQAQLTRLSEEMAARRDTATLTQQLESAERGLAAKRRLLQWLAEQGGDRPADGFAAQIEGLARQHRAGLRLTAITIGAGGRRVRLAGSTIDAADLVRYLARLGNEEGFAGLEFRTLQMDRSETANAEVEFVIDSERQEPAR